MTGTSALTYDDSDNRTDRMEAAGFDPTAMNEDAAKPKGRSDAELQ